MKKFLHISLAIVALIVISQVAMAQPQPPASPEAVPIDGGLSLLLAAGAGLGAKKAWDARKRS
ncbi:MAG: hypothetical protein Q8J69_03845 [Sphingobacteriaceae bacterium]|nr:hypothetical protein [Sphingobacteriaceae bacterium]